MRSFWENKAYEILKRMGEGSPVYQVSPESVPNNTPGVLHRNLMLPCDDLPLQQAVHKHKARFIVEKLLLKAKSIKEQA